MDELTQAVHDSLLNTYRNTVAYPVPEFEFAATLMVDRLRAGGISDPVIRNVLATPPRKVGKAPELAMGYAIGYDLASPDGDKGALVVMTFDENGPQVVAMTDDPAVIYEVVADVIGEPVTASSHPLACDCGACRVRRAARDPRPW